jgi:hypothetical protein
MSGGSKLDTWRFGEMITDPAHEFADIVCDGHQASMIGHGA